MSDIEVFGPVVLGTAPEEALERTLKEWLPTYLAWITRQVNRPNFSLPLPRSYTITSDWDHFPEDQLPAILLMCEGVEHPKMDGRREYRATFPLRVGVFVEAKDRKSTEQLAKYYAASIRALVTAKGSLGNFAAATTWIGESYGTRVTDRSQRTVGAAEIRFNTEVRNVVRRLAGPLTPLSGPNPTTEPGVEQPALPTVKKSTLTLTDEQI